MNEREELESLRRLAELEARESIAAPQISEPKRSPYSPINLAGAAIEPALSLASGVVAGPLSGYAGLIGAALPGDPGQGADWARAVQQKLTWQPWTQGGKTALEAISYPFQKYGEATDYLGGKAAEITGSPLVGATIKTAADVAVPYGASRALSLHAARVLPDAPVSRRLMQSAVKPRAADIESGAGRRAVSTMLDEGISPTSRGMEKVHRTVGNLNQQVEQAIAGSPETVSVVRAASRLREPFEHARRQVNPAADVAAVRAVWDEFKNSPLVKGRTEIPVQTAHALKKGTYRALGEKSYGEIGSAATEAQKAIARGLREETLSKVPQAAGPLSREARLMNVLDVAERRAIMEANKNPMGLALLAKNPYAWAGFMADRSAAFKGIVARMLYSSGDPMLRRIAFATMAANQTTPVQEY